MGEPRSRGARSAALSLLLALVIAYGVLAAERSAPRGGEDLRAGPPVGAPIVTLARSAPLRAS